MRRYLGSLSGFCRWLVKNDYLAANPVAEEDRALSQADTFKDDALNTLFITAKGDQWRDIDKPGNFAGRDHRFWSSRMRLVR